MKTNDKMGSGCIVSRRKNKISSYQFDIKEAGYQESN